MGPKKKTDPWYGSSSPVKSEPSNRQFLNTMSWLSSSNETVFSSPTWALNSTPSISTPSALTLQLPLTMQPCAEAVEAGVVAGYRKVLGQCLPVGDDLGVCHCDQGRVVDPDGRQE